MVRLLVWAGEFVEFLIIISRSTLTHTGFTLLGPNLFDKYRFYVYFFWAHLVVLYIYQYLSSFPSRRKKQNQRKLFRKITIQKSSWKGKSVSYWIQLLVHFFLSFSFSFFSSFKRHIPKEGTRRFLTLSWLELG